MKRAVRTVGMLGSLALAMALGGCIYDPAYYHRSGVVYSDGMAVGGAPVDGNAVVDADDDVGYAYAAPGYYYGPGYYGSGYYGYGWPYVGLGLGFGFGYGGYGHGHGGYHGPWRHGGGYYPHGGWAGRGGGGSGHGSSHSSGSHSSGSHSSGSHR